MVSTYTFLEHLEQKCPAQTRQGLKQPWQKKLSQNLHCSRDWLSEEQEAHLQGECTKVLSRLPLESWESFPSEVKIIWQNLSLVWSGCEGRGIGGMAAAAAGQLVFIFEPLKSRLSVRSGKPNLKSD